MLERNLGVVFATIACSFTNVLFFTGVGGCIFTGFSFFRALRHRIEDHACANVHDRGRMTDERGLRERFEGRERERKREREKERKREREKERKKQREKEREKQKERHVARTLSAQSIHV